MLRGDPIRIAVIYEPGKRIRPVWFELNGIDSKSHHFSSGIANKT